jgi:hypothetical protein
MLGASVERRDGGTPLKNASLGRGADSRPMAAAFICILQVNVSASTTAEFPDERGSRGVDHSRSCAPPIPVPGQSAPLLSDGLT